ncbi:hypothetical protein COT69_00565 [candidate division WWE3 bacterium CG09_land_8_20_14_0_10_39_24]|uniref:Trigger factor n=2 Tax=Katanobacteria TaxID=422282 RepID=A0A2G9XBJ8_UNCKA|nr:MAG: hypothetical protein AUJ94_02925 [bacterium CG2_30_40_12]OJI09434.1 MAG: hypothetical protein BK003_00550 [bacterium CG09_39_24]PIP04358.1 MAG: hypothetical protein COX53_02935 [candidate division WWE3 bacterium CG23_combo_of_CG06-09_8_20_14_all_40_14]PIS13097.1 MAG: hypothetical protein COT69_00565 [candidate division WWE3 bacterium CG09_land_8_20_14_0_10_39_24]PJE50908.1 MAG: hypothetical protein COV27_02370 [candidate division WWE3 bacterium CG10_big_fil_rev_8_21_14_0_10_39_14]
MTTTIEKLPKKTYKITITVEKDAVSDAFENSLVQLAKNVNLEGFRQGKAPLNLIKEKIGKKKLEEGVINHLVPLHYSSALKEHKLNPITNPKVEISQFEEGKDLIFTTTIVEKPDVILGEYKKAVKDLKSAEKPKASDILNKIFETVKIEIPEFLIEEETVNMFSNLINQTARLGITVEDYLKSQNKTVETLRGEYSKIAEENLKADLLLNEIANEEKVEVTDSEIEKAINAAPDEETKKALSNESQKWYIKSVLRKDKAIKYLMNLVVVKEEGK